MKLAIIGGTGREGYGLCLRWAQIGHKIIIGSRSEEKAQSTASKIKKELKDANIEGENNKNAAKLANIVVLSIPYEAIDPILDEIKHEVENKIIITLIVPLTKDQNRNYFKYKKIDENSAAEKIQNKLPNSKLVSTMHHISFKSLRDLKNKIKADVLVCGNFDDAKKTTIELIEDIKDLRAIDVGILENSSMIEPITPLLMNINIKHKKKGVQFKLTGF